MINSQKDIVVLPEMIQKRNNLLEQAKKAERIGELTRSASLLEELVSTMEEGETAAFLFTKTPIKKLNKNGKLFVDNKKKKKKQEETHSIHSPSRLTKKCWKKESNN